jgi:protoporphyrin/coproporphyrin ferrochelatase
MELQKVGVLLLNLGTPDGPDVWAVRRYLKDFLDDPRVIDIPAWIRKILLYAFILPFRPKQSAKAYQAIWDEERGAPLLFHTRDLAHSLQQALPAEYYVAFGMRYGSPSIKLAIDNLLKKKCDKIIVLPLFPQYSSAATGSALQMVLEEVGKKGNIPALTLLPAFYEDPLYIDAKAELIAPFLAESVDKVIFSYHSLPQRQIKKTGSECQPACRQNAPCHAIKEKTAWCYRAQCYQTSRLLAEKLQLGEKDYDVAFQSRLGRTVWIGPDIQALLPTLIQDNVKNIVIACPSFVADCLETLEEIGIRAQEIWHRLGGGKLTLVPCLNAHPKWVYALSQIVQNYK